MKIIWAPSAQREFDDAIAYMQARSVVGAKRVGASILNVIDLVAEFPNIAPRSRHRGLRQKAVAGTPYLVIYAVTPDAIEIRAIIHGRQKRRR